MPSYLHPGVYVEEIPSGVRTIDAVGTSTAAFIGYATKGPIGTPVLLLNFDDYDRGYGGIRDLGASEQLGDPMGFSVAAFFGNGGAKAYVVRLARRTDTAPLLAARGYIRKPAPPDSTDALVFTATSEGQWANGIVVHVDAKKSNAQLYAVTVGRLDDRGKLLAEETYTDVSLDDTSPRFIESVLNGHSANVQVAVKVLTDLTPPDGWTPFLTGTSTSGDLAHAKLDFSDITDADCKLAMALDGTACTIHVTPADYTDDLATLAAAIEAGVRGGNATAERRTNFTAAVVANRLVLTSGTRGTGSSVVVDAGEGIAETLKLGEANDGIEQSGQECLDERIDGEDVLLADGADGVEGQDDDYRDTLSSLVKVRDINVICLPGKVWDDAGQQAIQLAIEHAEATRSRMVLVDPPASAELKTELEVTDLGLPTSTYGVLYYPWVQVASPFYDRDDNPGAPTTLLVPPSGYAAGMWAKIDGRRGVWKAPAGVETNLLGLSALRFDVGDGEQDQLNPFGVNALRKLPGYGHVVWGARTLSTRANPEWRYVPVRRTAIFIEQSIYEGIQWAVFEGNDHKLWASLRSNIDAFMNGLWRSGAFQGEKASDAYFVRCDLGDTMTQADIDRGQVIVIVGFAPLRPAEFVIVRIQQKVAEQ